MLLTARLRPHAPHEWTAACALTHAARLHSHTPCDCIRCIQAYCLAGRGTRCFQHTVLRLCSQELSSSLVVVDKRRTALGEPRAHDIMKRTTAAPARCFARCGHCVDGALPRIPGDIPAGVPRDMYTVCV